MPEHPDAIRKAYTGEAVGLPPRPFLYTLDQLAQILSYDEHRLKTQAIYFRGRSEGYKSVHQMMAHNIAPPNETPEWRVTESELTRWLKQKGMRVYARSGFR